MQKHERWDDRMISVPEKNKYSLHCIVLCMLLFLILGTLYVIPSAVTQTFRPIVIAVFLLFPATYSYRVSRSVWVMIVFQFYLTIVFISHPITSSSFMAWASMLLFAAFFIVTIQRIWSKREIQLILNVVLIACVVFCIILFRENPDIFSSNQGEDLTFRGNHVNSNAAAFTIVPGALVGTFFTFFLNNRGRKGRIIRKLWYFGATVLEFIMLVGMGGRSAFFSAVIGALMIVWEWGEAIKKRDQRLLFRALLILFFLIIYHYGPIWTEGTHAYRLFDYDNLMDMNGRDDMAEQAMELIREHPMFGGGFDYWNIRTDNSLMVHNSFLSIGVTGGYTAIFLLGLFFIFSALELVQTRSLIPVAFFVEALFHSFTEPGMDYYAYIPLVLAFIIQKYTRSHYCKPEYIVSS